MASALDVNAARTGLPPCNLVDPVRCEGYHPSNIRRFEPIPATIAACFGYPPKAKITKQPNEENPCHQPVR